MSTLFHGEVALVTGAGSGIGRATALAFAREGAIVMAADRDPAGGERTVADIRAVGGKAEFAHVDVADEAEVEKLVRETVAKFGRLDCAHNNAGVISPVTPFHELSLDAWNRVVSIDLTAVFLCMKHEIRQMRTQQQGGSIVNTSSTAGIVGFPGLVDYVAAKHGVLGLTKTAAQEYAKDGIRVNAICPGTTDTPLIREYIGGDKQVEAAMLHQMPRERFGTPEEQAEAVVWLCSSRASFVNGDSMITDGGYLSR